MKHIANISSKGQITLPAELRRAFNIRSGDRLSIVKKGDHIAIQPDSYDTELEELRQIAKRHLKSMQLQNLSIADIKRRADAARRDSLEAKYGPGA